eukprot:709078-Rhodomonas_salina.1
MQCRSCWRTICWTTSDTADIGHAVGAAASVCGASNRPKGQPLRDAPRHGRALRQGRSCKCWLDSGPGESAFAHRPPLSLLPAPPSSLAPPSRLVERQMGGAETSLGRRSAT